MPDRKSKPGDPPTDSDSDSDDDGDERALVRVESQASRAELRAGEDNARPVWQQSIEYRVDLSPESVMAALGAVPSVVPARSVLPVPGERIKEGPQADRVLFEHGKRRFTMTREARRGGGVAGLTPTLHLDGEVEATDEGSIVRLSFGRRRSRQARTRALGFGSTLLFGLLWVALGNGALIDRALYIGAFLLVTLPVIFADRQRASALAEHAGELLSIAEAALGERIICGDPSPYRNRLTAASSTRE